ncbi:RHS repeat-associated core domain-containing protein [Kribbella sp. NPDC051587]|uniref:RHS repeat-associated core domain-containing protein n=1 Tax=Kribbella sp. NPDC051587 TaxID=3364119 RepID=UPI0037B8A5A0
MNLKRLAGALRVVTVVIALAVGTAIAPGVVNAADGKASGQDERTPLAEVADFPESKAMDPSWRVDSSGAFTDSIAIRVPEFHGITPKIALAYDSAAANGLAGVGWTLSGASQIERGSPGGGAPRYDASDAYFLDQMELVPCAQGSVSPSCTSGGTHSAKNEAFTKIALTGTGAASRWTVTAKDGTRWVYAPVLSAAADSVYRWGVVQVVDTKGNTVTYNWATNLSGCCWEYLDSITYNNTTIKFYYDQRTDTDVKAMGNGALRTVRGRIKTIDVRVGDDRVRAYKLSYTASSATARSLLAEVQQFGRDAVLDSSGAVTGGTAMPAVRTTYQAGAPAFVSGPDKIFSGNWSGTKYFSMDINGDGKTDMLQLWPILGSYQRKVWLSDGTDFALVSTEGSMSGDENTRYLPGDYTGDGKSDLLEVHAWGLGMRQTLWVSNGTGFTLGSEVTAVGRNDVNSRYYPMDVNGDGRTDVLELYQCGIFPLNYCRATWLSDGTTLAKASDAPGIGFGEDHQFYPADVNGDGKDDFVEVTPPVFLTPAQRHIWLSTGTGFVSGATDGGLAWVTPKADGTGSRVLMMDVNDDDKTDMVELSPSFTIYKRRTWISTGYSYVLGDSDTALANNAASKQLVMDVNGDKRMDMVALTPGFLGLQTKRDIWLSTGTGFTAGASDPTMGSYSCDDGECTADFMAMDVDGDMRTEMMQVYSTNFGLSKGQHVWYMGGAATDVLTSRTNEWGAVTNVTYAPSSTWTNTNNPPLSQTVSKVTDDAGPSAAATTSFSYSGGQYYHPERKFLGFRTQRVTKSCATGETKCSYADTTFRQDLAAIGQPEKVEVHAGDGSLLNSTVTEYTTNGTTIPRVVQPTGKWETTYAGAGTPCPGSGCKRTYTTREYNQYGEVVSLVEHGDNEVSGDERTTLTTFVPNTSAYIVNKPAVEKVMVGGTRLNETRTRYDGATTWNQAPSAGYATATARWLSTADDFVEKRQEFDEFGNLVAEVNEVGERTALAYDPTYHLFQVSETNALSQQVTAAWDPVCALPTKVIDINGQQTTVTHDALCRQVQSTLPGGRFERHTWVNVGDPATQYELVETPGADGSAQWSRRYLDGMQRSYRTVTQGPDAATGDIYVDTTYNQRGLVASTTAPYYWVAGQAQPTTFATTTTYDALDRATEVTAPDGSTRTKSYGLWSTTTVDESGRVTTDRTDAYGNRVAREQQVDGKTLTASYVFDLRNNLAKSTDPSGNVITYTTDSLGRKLKIDDPDAGVSTYEWNAASQLMAQTDAKNQRTVFEYDQLGRKTKKTSNAGTAAAATVTWGYDQARAGYQNIGRMTSATDAAGTSATDYDALGNVVKALRVVRGTPYEFRYGFDVGGRRLWTTYPDGGVEGTAADPLRYDATGRLKAIPGFVDSITYNAAGKITRMANANGSVSSRFYDEGRGWVTGIKTTSGATAVQNTTLTRDDSGKIMQAESPNPGESWTYSYDGAGQLTSAVSGTSVADNRTFNFDAAGNITKNSGIGDYTYGATKPHAVTAAGGKPYTYDAAGNMTSGDGRTLTWNGDGQLASVVKGGVTSTYTYDADGARVEQVEGGTVRRYLGADYEVDVTHNVSTRYVSISGTPVARVDGDTKYWLHTDHQGTVQAETNAAGQEVHRKTYRPFGEIAGSSGSLDRESRGFTAQRQDSSTGLLYLNARYYDPALGRFISPDPVIDGEANIGLNRYAYAANDPVNRLDYTGLSCKESDGSQCDKTDRPISRDEIIKRAQEWFDNQPGGYDQQGYSWGPGEGPRYRRDCSGYVSMAWHLGENHWTGSLPEVSSEISRDDLQAGDILDSKPTVPHELQHTFLFEKWIDKAAGTFSYYSFGGPKVSYETANINQPELDGHPNKDYRALRYNNVVDGTPAPAPAPAPVPAPAPAPAPVPNGVPHGLGPVLPGPAVHGLGPALPGPSPFS